ncbi:hypothetical protein DL96DRAFT_1561778 [Flagelloscypha sp. PMI_526]|nr:hypothetical protein DL96DRAFT_1561778 [Flagelloscypha sp. PMI_526]
MTYSLLSLPDELLWKVIYLSSLADILRLRSVCKALRGLTCDRSVWMKCLEELCQDVGMPLGCLLPDYQTSSVIEQMATSYRRLRYRILEHGTNNRPGALTPKGTRWIDPPHLFEFLCIKLVIGGRFLLGCVASDHVFELQIWDLGFPGGGGGYPADGPLASIPFVPPPKVTAWGPDVKLPTSPGDPEAKWTVLASHAAIPAVKYCGYFGGYIAFLDGLDEGNHQIALYDANSGTTISWNVDPPNIDNFMIIPGPTIFASVDHHAENFVIYQFPLTMPRDGNSHTISNRPIGMLSYSDDIHSKGIFTRLHQSSLYPLSDETPASMAFTIVIQTVPQIPENRSYAIHKHITYNVDPHVPLEDKWKHITTFVSIIPQLVLSDSLHAVPVPGGNQMIWWQRNGAIRLYYPSFDESKEGFGGMLFRSDEAPNDGRVKVLDYVDNPDDLANEGREVEELISSLENSGTTAPDSSHAGNLRHFLAPPHRTFNPIDYLPVSI